MNALEKLIAQQADGDLLSVTAQTQVMERFSLNCHQLEEASLEAGYLPARYQRNRQVISSAQQLQLFRSRVAVVGCGGLGGYVIEELARLGVGQIVAIDPDVFEEHNLNRQLLSSLQGLGQSKVEAAAERVAAINPAVSLLPIRAAFSKANGQDLFAGADVVVDAVDNIPTRLELERVCREAQIPLVHGAIAGWYGHVCTVFPGDDSVSKIYRHWEKGRGLEQELGNPSFTPGVVASFEVAEVCKVLLGKSGLLRKRKLFINLLDMEVDEVPL